MNLPAFLLLVGLVGLFVYAVKGREEPEPEKPEPRIYVLAKEKGSKTLVKLIDLSVSEMQLEQMALLRPITLAMREGVELQIWVDEI